MAHTKSPRPAARHAGGKTGRAGTGRAGTGSTQEGKAPGRLRLGAVPPLAPGFAGRRDAAARLAASLTPGSCVVLTPGSGFAEGPRNWLGASGKTQLAAAAAESLWRSGAVELLLWVTAAERACILAGYASAAVAATGIEGDRTAEEAAARFVSWLAETSTPWLVVLDDVPDVVALGALRPAGQAGRVLITTPWRTVPQEAGRDMPVGLYTVSEALASVTGRLRAGAGASSEDQVPPAGAIELIEAAGREPLALAQACAVMASAGMSCLEYRDYLIRRRQQVRTRPGEAPSAAAATWTLSLDYAELLAPGKVVRPVLLLIALLDGHGIPGAVLQEGAVATYVSGFVNPQAGRRMTADALRALAEAGLISAGDAGAGADPDAVVRISPVVQAAVLAAAPARLRDRAAVAAADALLRTWPPAQPRGELAVRYRACAAALWRAAAAPLLADGCHPLLIRLCCSFDEAGLAGDAVTHWERLAAHVGQAPGHPDGAAVTARLAAAYAAAGRHADAAAWYRLVLAGRQRALAPGSHAINQARISLGQALLAAGEHAQAVTVLTEAVTAPPGPAAAGPAPAADPGAAERAAKDVLTAQDALATAYLEQGKTAQAVALFGQVLGERERRSGARDPATLATRARLAAALLADGQVRAALSHTRQVLSARELALGATHPDTIAARAAHAAASHAAGRIPAALQHIERACADSAAVLGADHRDTLTRRVSLAHVYYAAARVSDAEAVLRDIAARCARTLPAGDPLAATVASSLATITGNSPEAERRTRNGAQAAPQA